MAALGCLLTGFCPAGSAFGRTQPHPVPSPPAAKRSLPKDAAERLAATATTAPQHASPDADYAITSLLSRTATPSNPEIADAQRSDALARRLWQNRILAPDPNEDAETRRDLRDLISRVRSVQFAGPDSAPAFSVPPETEPETERVPAPTATSAQPEPMPAPVPAATADVTPITTLSPATRKELEMLMKDPIQVRDPLEMAELLFLSGRPAEAAVFYERALAQIAPDDTALSEDRAWILFQLGNCLRETDMSKAKDTYMKLVTQYPNSPWSELAKAHGRLINWYQTAKPQQWMPARQAP